MRLTSLGCMIFVMFAGAFICMPLAVAEQGTHRFGIGLGMISGDTMLDSLAEKEELIWQIETEKALFVEGFYRYMITDHVFVEPGISLSRPDVIVHESEPGGQRDHAGSLQLINVRTNGGYVFNPGGKVEFYSTAGIGMVNWELEVDQQYLTVDDGNEFAFNFGIGADIEIVPDRISIGFGIYDYIWKIEPSRKFDYGWEDSFREYSSSNHIVGQIRTTFSF